MNKGIEKNIDVLELVIKSIEHKLHASNTEVIRRCDGKYEFLVRNDYHIINLDDIMMEIIYLDAVTKEEIDHIVTDMMNEDRTLKIKKNRVVPLFVPYIIEDSGYIFSFDYILGNQMIQYWDYETHYQIEKAMHLPYERNLKEIAFKNLQHMDMKDCNSMKYCS